MGGQQTDDAGRDGKVKVTGGFFVPALANGFQFFHHGDEGSVLGEIGFLVEQVRRKGVPGFFARFAAAREFVHAFVQVLTKGVIVHVEPIQAEHGELFGKLPVQRQIVDGRDQLPMRQITAGTEDHQDRWTKHMVSFHSR